MNHLRQNPIIYLFALLSFLSLGCQVGSVLPANTAAIRDDEAVIAAAVATVSAQTSSADSFAPPQTTEIVTADLENRFIEIYNRVNPAVVHIFVFDGDGFLLGTGSGFVIDQTGNIVTNNHVVIDGDEFEIVFASGERRLATLMGTDVDSLYR